MVADGVGGGLLVGRRPARRRAAPSSSRGSPRAGPASVARTLSRPGSPCGGAPASPKAWVRALVGDGRAGEQHDGDRQPRGQRGRGHSARPLAALDLGGRTPSRGGGGGSAKATMTSRQSGRSSQSPALRTSRVANAAHAVAAVSTAASTRTTTSGSRSPTSASTRTAAATTNAVPATQPGVNHGSRGGRPGRGGAAGVRRGVEGDVEVQPVEEERDQREAGDQPGGDDERDAGRVVADGEEGPLRHLLLGRRGPGCAAGGSGLLRRRFVLLRLLVGLRLVVGGLLVLRLVGGRRGVVLRRRRLVVPVVAAGVATALLGLRIRVGLRHVIRPELVLSRMGPRCRDQE